MFPRRFEQYVQQGDVLGGKHTHRALDKCFTLGGMIRTAHSFQGMDACFELVLIWIVYARKGLLSVHRLLYGCARQADSQNKRHRNETIYTRVHHQTIPKQYSFH